MACAPEQRYDLAQLGVATGLLLAEHQPAVCYDLEDATGPGNQLHLDPRNVLSEFSRHTGGPGFIASHHTIGNRDLHERLEAGRPEWNHAGES